MSDTFDTPDTPADAAQAIEQFFADADVDVDGDVMDLARHLTEMGAALTIAGMNGATTTDDLGDDTRALLAERAAALDGLNAVVGNATVTPAPTAGVDVNTTSGAQGSCDDASASPPSGTSAAYAERHGDDDTASYGDARRANSDRFSGGESPVAVDANADAEPSADASAGTLADHLGYDVDTPVPRYRRGDAEQGDAQDADASSGNNDFGWSDGGANSADADSDTKPVGAQSAYERRKQAEDDPAVGTMAAYRQKHADADDEDDAE